MLEVKEKIREVIRDWWNDNCRKTWRWDFDDPYYRNKLMNNLAERLFVLFESINNNEKDEN
jgi:hypothetical protein